MFEIPRLVLIGYGKEDITHGVVWSLSTVFGLSPQCLVFLHGV